MITLSNQPTTKAAKESEMYEITRLFIGGLLEGIEHTSTVNYEPTIGFICMNPCSGGSPYKIIRVRKID